MGTQTVPMVRMNPFKFVALLKHADQTSLLAIMANVFRDICNAQVHLSVRMAPMRSFAVSILTIFQRRFESFFYEKRRMLPMGLFSFFYDLRLGCKREIYWPSFCR